MGTSPQSEQHDLSLSPALRDGGGRYTGGPTDLRETVGGGCSGPARATHSQGRIICRRRIPVILLSISLLWILRLHCSGPYIFRNSPLLFFLPPWPKQILLLQHPPHHTVLTFLPLRPQQILLLLHPHRIHPSHLLLRLLLALRQFCDLQRGLFPPAIHSCCCDPGPRG